MAWATWMTWAALAVRVGGFAALLPVVLNRLPSAEVSVWLLFAAVTGLHSLADLGFSQTFARFLSQSRAARRNAEPESAGAHIASMSWVYRRLAIGSALLIGVVGTLVVHDVIARTDRAGDLWLAWGLIAATMPWVMYGNTYVAYLVGSDRIALQKQGETVVNLVSLALQGTALAMDLGVLGLVIGSQSAQLLQVAINRALCRRIEREDWAQARATPSDAGVIATLWPAAWRSMVGIGLVQGVWQGMAIGIANLLPPPESAPVLLALRVMQLVIPFGMAPFYTALPQLNLLRAEGRIAELTAAARRGMLRSHLVFVAGATAVLVAASPLLTAVGSRTAFVTPEFWAMLASAALLERYGAMHLQLYSSTNDIVWHVASAGSGSLWVATTLLLLPHAGTLAVPLGMGIANLCFYVPYCVGKSLASLPGVGWLRFERAALLPALLLWGAMLTAWAAAAAVHWRVP